MSIMKELGLRRRPTSARQKALEIDLDSARHGTFAEVGAGAAPTG